MGSAIEFKVLAQSHQLEPNLDRGQSTGHGSSDPIRMHVLLLAFWAADLHADVQLDFLSRNRSSFIFRKPTHGQRWLSLYLYRIFIPFHSIPCRRTVGPAPIGPGPEHHAMSRTAYGKQCHEA